MKFITAALIVLTLCLLGGTLLIPQTALASAGSNKCEATPAEKTKTEVGTFLQGICTECYDQGDCAIRDMEVVFVNVGNFTVEIVGALVLLMYVIGGVCFLISHGDPAWVTKGKQFIKISTLGLVIVIFGYAGIKTLQSAVLSGGTEIYVECTETTDKTQACGLASTCVGGLCLPKCVQDGKECVNKTALSADQLKQYEDCSAATAKSGCPGTTDSCCSVKSPITTTATFCALPENDAKPCGTNQICMNNVCSTESPYMCKYPKTCITEATANANSQIYKDCAGGNTCASGYLCCLYQAPVEETTCASMLSDGYSCWDSSEISSGMVCSPETCPTAGDQCCRIPQP